MNGLLVAWFRNYRRKKILAQRWPETWSGYLSHNVRLTRNLSESEQNLIQERVKVFVAEKHWEGCEGLELSDEIRVTIAANACLMLLGVADYYFDNVQTVLVFPGTIQRKNRGKVLVGGTIHHAGEAWQGGPIVLSWNATLRGGRNQDDGNNVVIHEFAHALDGLDGEMGGSLMFADRATTEQWGHVLQREYARLCDAKRAGHHSLLSYYGATNQAEFFAVASETFFERPIALKGEHSELFELLMKYYRVDPSNWQSG